MFKVSVKDFGPISEGTVDLKPLTIFVGPSNAGKSYLATVIYSLMQSCYGSLVYPYVIPMRYIGFRPGPRVFEAAHTLSGMDELDLGIINKWARNVESNSQEVFGIFSFGEEREISFATLPEELLRLIHHGVRNSLGSMEQSFGRVLERCHGEIADMQSRMKDATRLRIGLEQSRPRLILGFEEHQGSLRVLPDADWDISESKFHIGRSLLRSLQADAPKHGLRQDDWESYYDYLLLLMGSACATLFGQVPRNCYYLPAGRSGIAQGHKAIASILVRQSSFGAIRPLEIATLSGIITDFMGHMLTMEQSGSQHWRRDAGALEEVADFLEENVLRGKIDIDKDAEVTYPEITYSPVSGQPGTGKFPLRKTSSMVSELAPVVLFLKYLVNQGDLLVLEEPESHLHPSSQRQMARGIARLVNAGVKVVITTHSDYFVGQINNLLKLSRASKRKRANEGYEEVDCLKSEDVSAYHFKLDDNSGGSRIEELPILPDFGIDEQEFAAVSEDLYKETVSLQKIRTSR